MQAIEVKPADGQSFSLTTLVTDCKKERALVLPQLQVLAGPYLNMFQTPDQACFRPVPGII